MTIATQNELETDVEVRPDGRARVVLRGRLNEQTVVGCWGLLEKELLETKVETLQVDVSGLGFCDAAGTDFAPLPQHGKNDATGDRLGAWIGS